MTQRKDLGYGDRYDLPSRFWEPEDDRTDGELMAAYNATEHDDDEWELPFE